VAVYVDELRDYRALLGQGYPGMWCHMVTDGNLEELHRFALKIGMSRSRFQDHPRHPHYDLRSASRDLAVAQGAVEVTTSQLARMFRVGIATPPGF
jgi:hypothetical protein